MAGSAAQPPPPLLAPPLHPLFPPCAPCPLQVATLVQADWLFLLTDVPNLYTANPATDPTAQPIYEVPDLGKLHVSTELN